MITHNDVVDLLTYVAAVDGRNVGRADIKVWLDAATDAKWASASVAYRAIVKHTNAQPQGWVKPGHITQILKEVEREAHGCYRRPVPPERVMRMPLGEQDAWFHQRWLEHRDSFLEAWAQGDASKVRYGSLRALPKVAS